MSSSSNSLNSTLDENANKGSNVQVVVRCRPPTENEKRQGDASVVGCLNNNEVHLLTNTKGGKSGAKKIYTFDSSYGGTSTQADVYTTAVQPLVEEVLAGFNCTVFAYGQTGTGKTYTMEGELTADVTSIHAGVIPRSIHTIFDQLEHQNLEYSVKVSFLELYNEELSDLLAGENAEPERELRIFEDGNKRGMLVHNLEEVIVTSSEQVFALLEKSWQKRRTAETMLNKHSSRSHCVFIVTVHTKECDEDGEDIIKTGKLYLVDLAGSECVGKSGAQNQRAKEAGKINQSLLTLGRVINALVDKATYIPYRDSKLTRLLQESLGGRAKTVIIATVSPALNALDETMSTLEYAHRAKNIRNSPQVNQKMTKRAYMKDLLAEINSLKRDNEALRLKNGVFLPPEKYEFMLSQQKGDSLRLEELFFQLKVKEAEIEGNLLTISQKEKLLDELTLKCQSTCAELQQTREELENTQKTLQQTEKNLEETSGLLQIAETQLEEERLEVAQSREIISCQTATESSLRCLAQELHGTLENVVDQSNRLHAKVERQQTIHTVNADSVRVHQQQIFQKANDAIDGLNQQLLIHEKTCAAATSASIECERMHTNTLQKLRSFKNERVTDIHSSLQLVTATELTAREQIQCDNQNLLSFIKSVCKEDQRYRLAFRTNSTQNMDQQSSQCSAIHELISRSSEMDNSEIVSREALRSLCEDRTKNHVHNLSETATETCDESDRRLNEISSTLSSFTSDFLQNAARERQAIQVQIATLLQGFEERQTLAVSTFANETQKRLMYHNTLLQQKRKLIEEQATCVRTSIEQRSSEEAQADQCYISRCQHNNALLDKAVQEIESIQQLYSSQLEIHHQKIDQSEQQALDQIHSSVTASENNVLTFSKERGEHLNTIAEQCINLNKQLDDDIAVTVEGIAKSSVQQKETFVQLQQQVCDSYHNGCESIKCISNLAHQLSDSWKQNVCTGNTPQKTKTRYRSDFAVTEPHAAIRERVKLKRQLQKSHHYQQQVETHSECSSSSTVDSSSPATNAEVVLTGEVYAKEHLVPEHISSLQQTLSCASAQSNIQSKAKSTILPKNVHSDTSNLETHVHMASLNENNNIENIPALSNAPVSYCSQIKPPSKNVSHRYRFN